MARLLLQVLFAGSFSVLVAGLSIVDRGISAPGAGSFVSPIAGCEGIDCVKRYVALPDASFAWHDTHRRLSGRDSASGVEWTGYVLNMTSQRWVTQNAVNFPLWWHILVVVVPANLKVLDWATLHVEFGRNTLEEGLLIFSNRVPTSDQSSTAIDADNLDDRLPDLTDAVWSSAQIATSTRAVAVSLFNALNEYETFANDPAHQKRTQDDIKAYTWFDFIRAGATQPERIMELPVAKAVVRAMDATSEFTATLPSGQVTQFGVHGHSKMGTATWMAGAIDPRVKAIAPASLVFGQESLVAHGGNPALLLREGNPYEVLKPWLGTLEFMRLMEIVCPMNWRHRVTVPKLVIMDTNDVWMDEAIRDVWIWWRDMPEPRSLLFAQAGHDSVVVLTMPVIVSFFRGAMLGAAMPSIDYAFDGFGGKLQVKQRSAHAPKSLHLYFAVSCAGSYPMPRFLTSEWKKELLWSAPQDVHKSAAARGSTGVWTVDLYDSQLMISMANLHFNVSRLCSRGAFVQVEYEWPLDGWPFLLSTPVFVVPLWSTRSQP